MLNLSHIQKMKKIKIEIEVTGLEGWDVDWDNPDICILEVNELRKSIPHVLSRGLGIHHDDIRTKVTLQDER